MNGPSLQLIEVILANLGSIALLGWVIWWRWELYIMASETIERRTS